MSCFPGCMNEYQAVSLDRFDKENLKSTAYFLSHKHEDHMQGLSSASLKYRFQTNCHIKFFCSEVTRDLLKADPRHQWLEEFTIALKVNVPYALKVTDEATGKEKYTVTVTPLHAGHCPGSVMFLFEGNEGTALYTGDIRLSRSDLQDFQSLHSSDRPKHIDSLYIDTTFCVPEALFIPTRDESAEAVLHLTKEWLGRGRNHFVSLKCSAKIGYEHLFIRIAQELNTKVHVSEQKHKEYTSVAAFPSFSTPDPSSTRIHCCTWNKDRPEGSRLPCGYMSPDENSEIEVRTLMLSTMWFTQRANLDSVYSPRKAPYYYRVCYSFHSSYSELRDMVIYLKPSAVRPNVIPYKEKDFTIVQERLNRFQKLATEIAPVSSDSQPRKLGLQRKSKKRNMPSVSSESEGMDWGDLSPTKKPKLSQGSAEFNVNYKDIPSSQGSFKSTGSEKDDSFIYSDVEEEGSELDILDGLEDDEDVKLAKEAFEPVQSGSYGDYVSYVSDISDEENDEEPNLSKVNSSKDISEPEGKVSITCMPEGMDRPGAPNACSARNEKKDFNETDDSLKCNGENNSESSENVIDEQNNGANKSSTTNSGADSKKKITNSTESEKDSSSDRPAQGAESDLPSDNGETLHSVEKSAETSVNETAQDKGTECNKGPASAALELNELEKSCSDSKESASLEDNTISGHNKDRKITDDKEDNRLTNDSDKVGSVEDGKITGDKEDNKITGDEEERMMSDEDDKTAGDIAMKETNGNSSLKEDNYSSDVEEVAHISFELGEESSVGAIIDLTEEDELSDRAESESLFSSGEEDGVLSGDDEEAVRHRYILNSDGEVCFEEGDSDETVDEYDSDGDYSEDEIVISSDEDSPRKEPPAKQTARKSTAKKSSSSLSSDVNGCPSDGEVCDNANVIVLEDSLDDDGRDQNGADQSCNPSGDQCGDSMDDTNGAPPDQPKEQNSGDADKTMNEKILSTSAALHEKLSSVKEVSKNVDVPDETDCSVKEKSKNVEVLEETKSDRSKASANDLVESEEL